MTVIEYDRVVTYAQHTSRLLNRQSVPQCTSPHYWIFDLDFVEEVCTCIKSNTLF